MSLEIIRNDITKMKADAIVNTANPRPVIGVGTDGAIHKAAGPELLNARREIGRILCGESAITPAFGLDAKYVIHTVSPVWVDGLHQEEALLRKAYDSALALAWQHHCKSIAFPLMAAGSYGFPKDLALSIAVHAFNEFLLKHQMHIYLVIFNGEAFQLSRQLVSDVHSYVDDHYVENKNRAEYHRCRQEGRRLPEDVLCSLASCAKQNVTEKQQKSLQDYLDEQEETFSQALQRIIREEKLLDPEVYGRIYMNRTTFNKIKNEKDHRPQRKTALQLAVALRLNVDQAQDFLGKAGYRLSRSSRTDVILEYCLNTAIYDTRTIDALLVEEGEKAIFSVL